MKDVNGIGIKVNGTYKIPEPFSSGEDDSCLVRNLARSEDLYKDYDTHKVLPELSGTWGDFESFNECPPESERFYYEEEEMHGSSRHHLAECHMATSKETEFHTDWDAHTPTPENSNAFEEVFRLSFPDIPVEQCTDEMKTLQNPLDSLNGDIGVGDLINMQFRADSHSLGSQNHSPATAHRFDWKNSQGCRNLLLLLGVDSSETGSVDDNQAMDDSISTDNELLSGNEPLNPNGSKALIQTKLYVAPDSRQGSIFSYQFFVKTTATDTALPFLTVSEKKSFFNTNHLRFNF
ncbi:uncharacterized protein CLBA1 [Xenopus laevis]|uniref:Uncharacterized protein CLBA1 n=2 Tax=Xenopus laevis TaxID=8355 RepID=A0A1L8FA53_XENLA|nr:uncharacterized protein CLBA1 [Xenopus laevis]XP_041429030.1 uncharacterized protein CLBA1 [Xenopus laevis]OCT68456.1 hypothetical protein XELAEV_18039756mg [Xenopus laevis]